jgi:hypothetical protein
VGASVLEHRDTSLTHGPLRDEVTVGRTVLVGAAVDVQFTAHDHVGFEFLVGPYQNDVERSCIDRGGGPACTLTPFKKVSRGFHYEMQYLRTFGDAAWRPFAGGGLGVKAYRYEEFTPENVSPTIAGTAGVQRQGRQVFRIELRTLIVQDNPLLLGKTQVEMQARVAWLVGLGRQ